MLGYGEYWTCGFSASQWSAVLHPKDYNWVDFTFISLWFDRDRKMRDWTFEAYLMGLRVWVSFGWESPTDDVMEALKEVADTTNKPTHLNCPWCPAQAFPARCPGSTFETGYLYGYKCPAGHVFYIGEKCTTQKES